MSTSNTYRVTVAVTYVTFKTVIAATEQEARTMAASSVNSEMSNTRIPAYKYEGITMIVPERMDNDD